MNALIALSVFSLAFGAPLFLAGSVNLVRVLAGERKAGFDADHSFFVYVGAGLAGLGIALLWLGFIFVRMAFTVPLAS